MAPKCGFWLGFLWSASCKGSWGILTRVAMMDIPPGAPACPENQWMLKILAYDLNFYRYGAVLFLESDCISAWPLAWNVPVSSLYIVNSSHWIMLQNDISRTGKRGYILKQVSVVKILGVGWRTFLKSQLETNNFKTSQLKNNLTGRVNILHHCQITGICKWTFDIRLITI